MNNEAIVLLSGGIDSAACAHFLRDHGYSVRGLFVDYGQKAAPLEKDGAEALSDAVEIPLGCISLASSVRFGAGETTGRNAFIVFAALLTNQPRIGVIALGIHSGTTYYDCSMAFTQGIDRLLAEHSDGRVRLSTPFITWSKKNIFDYYVSSGLPIGLTYSCENGQLPPCGTCLSCRDRRMLGC